MEQGKNQKNIIEAIFDICERDGDIQEVPHDYYQQFIAMDAASMRSLVYQLIFSRVDDINDTDRWKNDDVLLDSLCSDLFLIMCGLMFFSEGGGQPVIAKPTHMPTDEEIEKLTLRSDNARETIREVLWEILNNQET